MKRAALPQICAYNRPSMSALGRQLPAVSALVCWGMLALLPGSLSGCQFETSTIPLQAPVLNPGCKMALPVDEPEPENITRDIHGRPRFDLYRDLCGEEQITSFPTCSKSGHDECAAQA